MPNILFNDDFGTI